MIGGLIMDREKDFIITKDIIEECLSECLVD